MVTNILLFIIIIIQAINAWLYYKSLPAEKKLEIQNKVTGNETTILEWQPPESDEQIAFREAMKRLEEMRK